MQRRHRGVVPRHTFVRAHAEELLLQLLLHLLLLLHYPLAVGKHLALVLHFRHQTLLRPFLIKSHHLAKVLHLRKFHGILVRLVVRESVHKPLLQFCELGVIRLVLPFPALARGILLLLLQCLLVLRLRLEQFLARHIRALRFLLPICHVNRIHPGGIFLVVLFTPSVGNAVQCLLFRFPVVGRVAPVLLLLLRLRKVRFRFRFLVGRNLLVLQNALVILLLNLLHAFHVGFVVLFAVHVRLLVDRVLLLLPRLLRLEFARLGVAFLLVVHRWYAAAACGGSDCGFVVVRVLHGFLFEVVAVDAQNRLLLFLLLLNVLFNVRLVVFQMRRANRCARVHGASLTSAYPSGSRVDALVFLNLVFSLFQLLLQFRFLLADFFQHILCPFNFVFPGQRNEVVVQGFLVRLVLSRGGIQLRIVVRDDFVQRNHRLLPFLQ